MRRGHHPAISPARLGPGVWKVLGLWGQTGRARSSAACFPPTPGSEGLHRLSATLANPSAQGSAHRQCGYKLRCVLAVVKGCARWSQVRTRRVVVAVPEPRALLQDGQAQHPSRIRTVHVWTNRQDPSPAPPTAPRLTEKSFSRAPLTSTSFVSGETEPRTVRGAGLHLTGPFQDTRPSKTNPCGPFEGWPWWGMGNRYPLGPVLKLASAPGQVLSV